MDRDIQDPALKYRFREIDRRLSNVELDSRTRADGATVVREIQEIRKEIKEVEKLARGVKDHTDESINDMIRSGRAENLKLIAYTLLGFATVIGGIFGFGGKI
jgi:hypothetical protein